MQPVNIDQRTSTARTNGRLAASAARLGTIAAPRASERAGGVFWRDVLRRRMLAVADALAALLAICATLAVADAATAFWSALFLPIWLLIAKLHNLYDRDHRALRHLTADELPAIAVWAFTSTVATLLLLRLTPGGALDTTDAVWLWAVAAVSAVILRAGARWLWRHVTPPEATLLAGEGFAARAIRRKVELFHDIHVRIIGECREADDVAAAIADLPALDRVIVAPTTLDATLLTNVVGICRERKLKLTVVPPGQSATLGAAQLHHVAELPVIEYNTWDTSRSTLFLKRGLDVVASAAGLVLLLPLFAVIALLITLDSRGPIVFSHTRAGVRGRPYRMLKFRTMVANAEDLLCELVELDRLEKPMFKLDDDPRVTRAGRFLRRGSLDELPQLVNVLKGEMSLVGPRPEQVDLVERYADEHRFRLAVKPGMTGPMQVYGRGRLTFEERLAVEREYIENMSIVRDLKILALTVGPVLSGRGAS